MSGAETRKDELAVRALSRLADPPVPDGLAARIAARATAAPQVGAIAPDRAPVVAVLPPAPVASARHPVRRWRTYAAASVAAALLLSVGLVVGRGAPEDRLPLAKADPVPATRTGQPAAAPTEVADADAAPADAKISGPSRGPHPRSQPAMVLPVPMTPPPAGLPQEDKFPEVAPAPDPTEQERLAQTGPQIAPQGGGSVSPVYGPTAPQGLGIVGSSNGPVAIPGEGATTPRAPRSGPPGSPPPSGMPGPSMPRGPGSRL